MPKLRIFGGKNNNSQPMSNMGGGIFPARVIKAMLEGESNPEVFKQFGEYKCLGGIFFNSINKPNSDPSFDSNSFALPLFPNLSQVPVENEIVYIINLPSSNVQSNVNSMVNYYFQSINIWGSVHHNAIPDPIDAINRGTTGAQTRDYQQIEGGIVRRVTDGSTEINLGDTFNERIDVRNLQPYEGDIIHEGRWGQSIRFGSTVSGSVIPNPWSDNGENGDPLTIIRNGQHEEDTDPWVPQVEDINTDASSIYLTSNQLIPINASSTSYLSYFSPPTPTNEYVEEQIILNSGRLLLNSKSDSILLSSFNTINLNSVNSVNIDSKTTIIKSNTINLGDKNATEPVILGNKFLDDFEELVKNLNSLATALQQPIGGPGLASPPVIAIVTPAVQVAQSAGKMLSKIKQYKSTVTNSK